MTNTGVRVPLDQATWANNLFENVTPRPEVLSGQLTDAMFAASLEDVVSGRTSNAYTDPATFFAATHPSAGLRTLLNQALGRLSGADSGAASVLRLETSLGGGKTHNLIALYYTAHGKVPANTVREFCDPSLLPTERVNVGVFVGTGSSARRFPVVNGIETRTLWGYLAAQIGGAEGYALVAEEDAKANPPGSNTLRMLFANHPTLIMIDELASYYRAALAVNIGRANLAGLTSRFIMSLVEAVDSSPNAVLVLTTTATTDAFGEETGQVLSAMGEVQAILARKEMVLRPSEEADLPRILSRRLFASIVPGASTAVGSAYADAADSAAKVGLDLPEAMTGIGGFGNRVANSYPFHPSLVEVLDKRLSTIPNFQRTRGALRLLARAVRRLWNEQPSNTQLIHLHHINLSDAKIAEEVSSRIDRAAYEPVIRSDIASSSGGSRSHAEEVDKRMASHYARRLATTIYLYSLTRETPGITAATAYAAVLAPGTDSNVLQRALSELDKSCWYLHSDDLRGLRFSTEPSLVKLIQQAEAGISPGDVARKATMILSEQYKDGTFKVRRSWEQSQVPDNSDDLWLYVAHWDDFGNAHGVDPRAPIPDSFKKMWNRTPSDGMRLFRNRMVFAVPNATGYEAMVRAVRSHLALNALSESIDGSSGLSIDKIQELKDKAKQSQLMARVAVCNHVNILYIPRRDGDDGLDIIELAPFSTASVPRNQCDTVLEQLASMGKLLRTGDSTLDPGYVKSKLGTRLEQNQPTAELIRVFASRADLQIVTDRQQLVSLVTAGVRSGEWEYYDAARGDDGWATATRPAVSYRLGEDTFLAPVGSAPPPKPALCQFCGTAHPGNPCPPRETETHSNEPAYNNASEHEPVAFVAPSQVARLTPTKVAKPTCFNASGSSDVALAEARNKATDAGRSMLVRLTGIIERRRQNVGQDLTRLFTIVKADTKGASLIYNISVEANPSATYELKLHQRGTPNDCAPLREMIRQTMANREARMLAQFEATFDPPVPLSGELVGRLIRNANDTGPGEPCDMEITTEGDEE